MSFPKYYQQNKKLLSKKVDNEIVIVNRKTGEYSKLTDVSAFIWETLEKKINFEDIIEKITSNYQIDKKTAKEDLVIFLEEAVKSKLINQFDK